MAQSDEIETLIGRLVLGDRAAFTSLYAATAPKLFGVTLRILGDRPDAEEALQECFVKVWRHAERFRPGDYPAMAWLVSIARNAAIDRLRARRAPARDLDSVTDLADSSMTPEAAALNRDEGRRIDHCLGKLGPDRAKAVRAAYVDGFTYEELAERFSVPINTMRTWLRRSLLSLRECLSQ
jgi:RNA polymerase sigma-70 factor (ECF subfamily)